MSDRLKISSLSFPGKKKKGAVCLRRVEGGDLSLHVRGREGMAILSEQPLEEKRKKWQRN